MLQLRKSVQHDGSDVNSYEDKVDPCGNLSEDLAVQNGEDAEMTQIELGNLRVSNLGMCSVRSNLLIFHSPSALFAVKEQL
jgi:hypothetical protein